MVVTPAAESPLRRAHASGQSGWVVCSCGYTELVINESWRMAGMWPGLKCPSCRHGYMMACLTCAPAQPQRRGNYIDKTTGTLHVSLPPSLRERTTPGDRDVLHRCPMCGRKEFLSWHRWHFCQTCRVPMVGSTG